MRAAYLAQDRPDIAEAVKQLARVMSCPSSDDLVNLKRLARYLKGAPVTALEYSPQESGDLVVYTDSDWAGDPQTRRSTSGVLVMRGSHLLKHSSTVQQVIGLSSAESEYYALTKGACTGLGVQSHMQDWGSRLPLSLHTDYSSPRSFAMRRGVGKSTRHIETRLLWLQERVARKHLSVQKVHTDVNLADVLTKALPQTRLRTLCEAAGQR